MFFKYEAPMGIMGFPTTYNQNIPKIKNIYKKTMIPNLTSQHQKLNL
jgi:hypothetical protein